MLLVSGCGAEREPDIVTPVRVHLAPGCGAGLPIDVQLEALGDFDPTPSTSDSVPGDGRNVALGFPESTRSIEARGQGAQERFAGVGLETQQGEFDILLWPEREACTLYEPPAAGSPYPSRTGGEALGVSRDRRTLLVAGGFVGTNDAARAAVVKLDTGLAEEVIDGMLPARAFATITEFGDGALLVAGGVDPSSSAGALELAPPLASASVFELESGRFDRSTLILLAQPRARHAATALVTGETLLVGGRSATGLPLATLELVSPDDRSSKVAGLATLRRPRIAPVAFTLDDGRVFIAGGTDSVGASVDTLEWLAPDGSAVVLERSGFATTGESTFAPLPGGGVLAVGVCPPASSECKEPARRVLRLRADGTADTLPDLPLDAAAPVLLAAADGSPWLFTGSSDARSGRRFDPWSGAFVTPAFRPTSGPSVSLPAAAVDGGSFAWLEDATTHARVRGFRHDVRGELSRQVAPLLLGSAAHVVPTRAPDAELTYDGLGLLLDGSGAKVVVTDLTFADVTLTLTLASGTPPRLALGSAVVGSSDCPWPEGDDPTLVVARKASELRVSRGSRTASCPGPSGRVGIALSAPGALSRVRAIELSRRGK